MDTTKETKETLDIAVKELNKDIPEDIQKEIDKKIEKGEYEEQTL